MQLLIQLATITGGVTLCYFLVFAVARWDYKRVGLLNHSKQKKRK